MRFVSSGQTIPAFPGAERHGGYARRRRGDCADLDFGGPNRVLHHVSMKFSTDGNISSLGGPPENLTMQWALNAQGLESHSASGQWDQNHTRSFIRPPGNIRGYALSRFFLDRHGNPNFSLSFDHCRRDGNEDANLNGTNAGYAMATGTDTTLSAPASKRGRDSRNDGRSRGRVEEDRLERGPATR